MYSLIEAVFSDLTDMELANMTDGEMEMTIQVSGAFKSYGWGSRKNYVLRDFNMKVPRGYIYGLLGEIWIVAITMKYSKYKGLAAVARPLYCSA